MSTNYKSVLKSFSEVKAIIEASNEKSLNDSETKSNYPYWCIEKLDLGFSLQQDKIEAFLQYYMIPGYDKNISTLSGFGDSPEEAANNLLTEAQKKF